MTAPQRIAKFLSAAGVASRRKAEDWILQGRISVNGQILATPAFLVDAEKDVVLLDGKRVAAPPEEKTCILLNKPAGYTCTATDRHASHTIYELLPEEFRTLRYVGRLDRETEGLLLLTNDGDLIQKLTHPSNQAPKVYMVLCKGRITSEIQRQMLRGIHDAGDFLKPDSLRILSAKPDESLMRITLKEGKKRELRRLCDAVGLPVRRLARIQQASISIGELPQGKWRKLSPEEYLSLKAAAEPPKTTKEQSNGRYHRTNHQGTSGRKAFPGHRSQFH